MKKIITILFFIIINICLPSYSNETPVSSEQYQAFLNNYANYNIEAEKIIEKALDGITIEKGETLEFKGIVSKEGKLSNIKEKSSSPKGAVIINKLEGLTLNKLYENPFCPDYTKASFDLFINKNNNTPYIAFNINPKKGNGTKSNISYLQEYLSDLQEAVKQNWHPIKDNGNEKVVIRFFIDKDGNLLFPKIIQPSNNEENNLKAIEAVRKTTPYKALVGENFLIAEFTLEVRIGTLYEKKKLYVASLDVNSATTNNLKPYLKLIKSEILKTWRPVENYTPYEIKLNALMNKKGEFSNVKVIKTSTNQAADSSAIEAVEKTTLNIQELDFIKTTTPIIFIFDYTPNTHSTNESYMSISGEKYTGPINNATIPVNGRIIPKDSKYYQILQNTGSAN